MYITIQDLKRQPHLSTSAINEYLECGLSYYFSRVAKVEPDYISTSLVLGSCIHKTLEQFYLSRGKGQSKTLEELLHLFEGYWNTEVNNTPKLQFKEGESSESLVKKGCELISLYYNQLPSDPFMVLGTEVPFRFEVEGIPYPIIGVIDLIEIDSSSTIIITDFKTSSRAYSRDEIDKSLQLTVYYMALRRLGYAESEILLRFDCLIKTKSPRFEQFWTIRTSEDEQRAIRKMQEVWNGIEKQVFVPNDTSWKCGFCAYKNHCNAWFLREAV